MNDTVDRYVWAALVGGAAWLFGIAAAGVYFGVWAAVAVWVGAPALVFGGAAVAELREEREHRARARARRDHPAGSALRWGQPGDNRWKAW